MDMPSFLYRCGPCDQTWSCGSFTEDGGLSPCPRCSLMRPAVMREADPEDEDQELDGHAFAELQRERDELREFVEIVARAAQVEGDVDPRVAALNGLVARARELIVPTFVAVDEEDA